MSQQGARMSARRSSRPGKDRAQLARDDATRAPLPANTGPADAAPAREHGAGGHRYVYGVIESSAPRRFGESRMGGALKEVYTVHCADIAAVVSQAPSSAMDLTRANALAHEQVIESVMRDHTIIPMSFGTVFDSDDDIRMVLLSAYAPLKDILQQLAGKLEFGLKVTWDRGSIVDELQRHHPEIRRLSRELPTLPACAQARWQQMLDAATAECAIDYVRDIHASLRDVCAASRHNKPVGEATILNAAFLVESRGQEEFEAALTRLAEKYGDRLHFQYSGPWPVYNFVDVRLAPERGGAG